jgi:hypothetical protein
VEYTGIALHESDVLPAVPLDSRSGLHQHCIREIDPDELAGLADEALNVFEIEPGTTPDLYRGVARLELQMGDRQLAILPLAKSDEVVQVCSKIVAPRARSI